MRTYIRTLFNDIFEKNFFVNLISSIVNFYCKLRPQRPDNIKFFQKMPIEDMKRKSNLSFQSVSGDKIDCK